MVSYTSKAVNDAIIETTNLGKEKEKSDSKHRKITYLISISALAVAILAVLR